MDKKNLYQKISIPIFIAIILIILACISVFFDPANGKLKGPIMSSERSYTYLSDEAPDTLDVLILGDSLTYTAYNTMQMWDETGITTYVCGRSGERPAESYFFLKKALRTQHPKVVLMEMSASTQRTKLTDDLACTCLELAGYYLPVFRYHNQWKNYFDDYPDTESPYYKGYQIRETIAAYLGGDYMVYEEDPDEMTGLVKLQIHMIKRLCDKNGIAFVMICSPSPSNYSMNTHDDLQAMADQLQTPFLDLNLMLGELQIDWNVHALDAGDHLNIYGATKVTAYLEQYLKEQYDLADHRQDAMASDWNDTYEEYLAELELRGIE